MNSGKIYVSKKNIFDLLDEDDDEKINKMIDEDILKEFELDDFNSQFKIDVQNDLECLLTIQDLWKNINFDPKIKKLISILKKDEKLKNNKIVIFTESTETGMYLLKELSREFQMKCYFTLARVVDI